MARQLKNEIYVTDEQITRYQTLTPLLEAMFNEFRELSKKKPDGALNKRKVEVVNRLLKDVLSLLDKEPTRPYLDLLDEDELPQNSDVLLLLSQASAAMNAFQNRYYTDDNNFAINSHSWKIK